MSKKCAYCDFIILDEAKIACPKCGGGLFERSFECKNESEKDEWKDLMDSKLLNWLNRFDKNIDLIRLLLNPPKETIDRILVINTVCYETEEVDCINILKGNFRVKLLPSRQSQYFSDHEGAYLVTDREGNRVIFGFHEDIGLLITAIGLTTSVIAFITVLLQLIAAKNKKHSSYNSRIIIKEYEHDRLKNETIIELPKEKIRLETLLKSMKADSPRISIAEGERLLERFRSLIAKNEGAGIYVDAMMFAATSGHANIIKTLAEEGVDVNFVDQHGDTALIIAAGKGHHAIVELLLASGADINATNKPGESALHKAASGGFKKIVEVLIRKGAEIDLRSRGGWTALMFAAYRGHKDIVDLLAKSGANLDIQGGTGNTALLEAVREGHRNVIRILLNNHVNVDIRDKNGWTALRNAKWHGYSDIVRLLEKVGASE